MRVTPIPCLSDNYAYLVECEDTNESALVDASEAAPVLKALEATDARAGKGHPKEIWSTHHHPDHVGGNEELVARWKVPVLGHASDRGRIPAQTRFLESGETFLLGKLTVRVHHIPGHTLGAIAYLVSSPGGGSAVFTGDTLFVAGCGRMFEGTPAQMHGSLAWLAAEDAATMVYCGHEYTAANLRFAASVEPSNPDVAQAAARTRRLREDGKPTVPSTLGEERRHNPFLRAGSPEIRKSLGIAADADDVTAFAAIRKAKDGFR
jgi:hydroxyacylglutathione hydrolase